MVIQTVTMVDVVKYFLSQGRPVLLDHAMVRGLQVTEAVACVLTQSGCVWQDQQCVRRLAHVWRKVFLLKSELVCFNHHSRSEAAR